MLTQQPDLRQLLCGDEKKGMNKTREESRRRKRI